MYVYLHIYITVPDDTTPRSYVWAGCHNPLDLLFENSTRYLLLLYTLTIFFSYIASSITSI